MSGCRRCGRPEDHAIHGLVSKEGFHDFVPKPKKVYLGDGAYYEFDGHGVSLTAENGIRATDRVYLEPEVIVALLRALGEDFDPKKLKEVIGG